AVLPDEDTAVITLGQWPAGVIRETDGRRVRPERVVGHSRLRYETRSSRLDAFVDVRAKITEWPAKKVVAPDGSKVVGHEVPADPVALVDYRKEHSRLGMPGQPVRIAQTRREDAHVA